MAATGNLLTYSITKLEMLCGDLQIGVATGFFLKKASDWFLVTNWHVLSGRNPENGQPRHIRGAVPDRCRFYTSVREGLQLGWAPSIRFLGDAMNDSATWYQHPSQGQNADIAVLPIEPEQAGIAKDLLDQSGHDQDMFIDLGENLFIPGYPLGFAASGHMPIWKRASLASSLEVGHGMDRFFYIDTATREGMSGSPCLALSNWRHYSLDRVTNQMRIVERPLSWRLLGVYSGRRNPSDNFEAQIGIVWRENLVYETIAGVTRASVRLSSP